MISVSRFEAVCCSMNLNRRVAQQFAGMNGVTRHSWNIWELSLSNFLETTCKELNIYVL